MFSPPYQPASKQLKLNAIRSQRVKHARDNGLTSPLQRHHSRSPLPSGRLTPAVPPASPQHPACLTLPSFPLHSHCPSRSFKRESMDFSPPLQVCKGLFIGGYLERQRESHDTLRNFLTPHPSPPPQGGREPGEGIWPSGRKRPAPSRGCTRVAAGVADFNAVQGRRLRERQARGGVISSEGHKR